MYQIDAPVILKLVGPHPIFMVSLSKLGGTPIGSETSSAYGSTIYVAVPTENAEGFITRFLSSVLQNYCIVPLNTTTRTAWLVYDITNGARFMLLETPEKMLKDSAISSAPPASAKEFVAYAYLKHPAVFPDVYVSTD